MTDARQIELDGSGGRIAVHRWDAQPPTWVAVLAHGYGEHAGRYQHVAEHLTSTGAAVYAPDHRGHGLSEGERALVEDAADLVSDLAAVADLARTEHPDLPLVLIGHSMGGLLATRLVQTTEPKPTAIVLSAPVIGGNPELHALMGMDPIPDVPLDPSLLSRDPAVGDAYAADELVYHGPFKLPTLQAMFAAMDAVADGPDFGGVPTLWVQGEEDALAQLALTRPVVERLGGDRLESHVYPGAKHEVFNETNRDEVLAHVTDFVTAAARVEANRF